MLQRFDAFDLFEGKTLLITGGTGSFGHAVLRRFLRTGIREIRIFSRDEKKQEDLRRSCQDPRLRCYLGDVRDRESLVPAMHQVDFLFHAAALKQVPSCEFFPLEAVKTNILGTENVLTVAIEAGVEKVICLSTDKAAYPINAMGISKAMMEKIYLAKSQIAPSSTVICGTRYGNILASRGSVIPLFIEQLQRGEPLTVTDPRMTRFMMSLEESIDLVLFAFAHGQPGDLLVQKAPACTIATLATATGTVFGVKPTIREIGIRHGEKSYETLLTCEEMARAIDLGDCYRVPPDLRRLNDKGDCSTVDPLASEVKAYTSQSAKQLSCAEVVTLLRSLDPIKDALSRWKAGASKATPSPQEPVCAPILLPQFHPPLPHPLTVHRDARGSFFEWLKSPDWGQVSVSVTKPGHVRGGHWHTQKRERFCVAQGDATITLHPIHARQAETAISYLVRGSRPSVVEIPPGYLHTVENTGETDLILLIWCDTVFDPTQADTYTRQEEDAE